MCHRLREWAETTVSGILECCSLVKPPLQLESAEASVGLMDYFGELTISPEPAYRTFNGSECIAKMPDHPLHERNTAHDAVHHSPDP